MLQDCSSDCQQKDGLETAHNHPPPIGVGGGGGGMPIKPPPPTSSPNHNLHHQGGLVRSPVPFKNYASISPGAINSTQGAGRVTLGSGGGSPLQPNSALINHNSHHEPPISSSMHHQTGMPVNPTSPSPQMVNNNQLHHQPQSPNHTLTGSNNGANTPPKPRPPISTTVCATGGNGGGAHPARLGRRIRWQ